MKQTRILMDMPITVEIVDKFATGKVFEEIYDYFNYVDQKFSPFKKESELTLLNEEKIKLNLASADLRLIFKLAEETKKQTDGYFEIYNHGKADPSGLVKGWAIFNAAKILQKKGFLNFYVDAGGDIQVAGQNKEGKNWTVGIRNPFNRKEIVKVLTINNQGVATSGTYIRGQHIYDPKNNLPITDVISLTVIGPNVYEADRLATAAFAMGKNGLRFIEDLDGFEGYMIDKGGLATFTHNFEKYTTLP